MSIRHCCGVELNKIIPFGADHLWLEIEQKNENDHGTVSIFYFAASSRFVLKSQYGSISWLNQGIYCEVVYRSY